MFKYSQYFLRTHGIKSSVIPPSPSITDITIIILLNVSLLPDNSETKDIFAAIFGDYGEPNAIMVLRKFAKNLIAVYKENFDRELFSRIMMVMSVIEGLGGLTDDLMD